ncbi:MAG: hypothetical protein IJH07_05885 [Ruminococcus sp.]|nr:hypothetical protein [Ruminococcus sp.]
MKGWMRIIACLAAIFLLLAGFPCAASDGFYCTYTPKTENSSVFYIDVYSSAQVSAAVLELYFDDSFAEYRETSAVVSTSVVRDTCENGCVKLAFADSGVVTGQLFRAAFKALQAGTVTFTLRVTQAADAQPMLLSGFADYSLEVKLGKNDVISGSSAKVSSKVSTASSKSEKSASGSRSYLREVSGSDEEGSPIEGGVIDVRRNYAWTYVLIGIGAVLLVAALIFAGVLIGRKNTGKDINQASKDTESADDYSAEGAADTDSDEGT